MKPRAPARPFSAPALYLASALLVLFLAACVDTQASIDEAIAATRTADEIASRAISTGIAATLAALPSPSPLPTLTSPPSPEPSSTPSLCTEDMSDVQFFSAGTLKGGRFLVTLEKATAFQSAEYVLLLDGVEYKCTPLIDRTDRIYCIGTVVPELPVGTLRRFAEVRLLESGGTCPFPMPFDTIPLPPKPTPDVPSGGGSGGGYN